MRALRWGRVETCAFALVLGIALTACAAASSVRVGSGEDQARLANTIGVAALDRHGVPCLAIERRALPEGTAVTLISVAPSGTAFPAKVEHAVIAGRRTAPCEPAGNDAGDAFYRLAARPDSVIDTGYLYVAIVGRDVSVRRTRPDVRVELEPGHPYSLHACTSTEGIHLSLWSGEPKRSDRAWHRYHYLGYDVEPTCAGDGASE